MTDFRLPEGTSPGRAALRVGDLDEAVAFYRDVVGLAAMERTATGARLGAGGEPLLELSRDADAAPREASAAGLYHDAFLVPSREALGEALARIRERWTLSGAADHGVSEALYLEDPEGNGVEIYRDRPREAWPTGEDGRLRMGTDPLDLEALAASTTDEEGRRAETDEPPEAARTDDEAPPGTVPDGVAPGTTLGHVHLEVTSPERSRAFYVGTLGLGVRQEWNGAVFLAAGTYHHHVGVNAWRGRSRPAEGLGLAWFELAVPDEGTVETLRRRVADAGLSVREREDGIEVADPDGIAVRVRADG